MFKVKHTPIVLRVLCLARLEITDCCVIRERLSNLIRLSIKVYSGGLDTLSREGTLSKLFFFPSENGSTLKGKDLLLRGANSFSLEQTKFQVV